MAVPVKEAAAADRAAVAINVIMNIISSVALVNVNKALVTYGFRFILLLTGCHFLTGYLFLTAASAPSLKMNLFVRPAPIDTKQLWLIAAGGIASIALMNYSLKANSVGTYQILKVAVLPTTMTLSFLQSLGAPTRKEMIAAALVVAGATICTASDVRVSLAGLLIGFAAVLATAQYQIWQGTVQSRNGISSTQAMYLMSLPQAMMTFCASVLFETGWSDFGKVQPDASAILVDSKAEGVAVAATTTDDIWTHAYAPAEIGIILVTCVLAVLLNYSTIAVIGKVGAGICQAVWGLS